MLNNTREELDKFGKNVIKGARTNLTKKKKNVDKKLYNSLDYKLNVSPNSFELKFSMEDYGKFQDQGVSGNKKKYKTPFAFTTKQPPSSPLAEWAKKRRIRLRDDKGRFQRGNYKTIGYLIARSIKKNGIQPSNFFSRPFELNFKRLPEELRESFALDLEDFLAYTQKK